MAATPATIGGSRHGTIEPRVNSPSGSGAESEPVIRAATDDEILGLTTKVRRRDSRGVQTPTETARGAKDLDQLELDLAGDGPRRSERRPAGESLGSKQKGSQNGDAEASNGPAGAANEAATLTGAAEPVSYTHLDVYKRQDVRAAAGRLVPYLESGHEVEDIRRRDCLLYTSRCV